MALMEFYRMLAQLACYYTFAGAAASCFGGGASQLPVFLLSACYVVCGRIRKKAFRRKSGSKLSNLPLLAQPVRRERGKNVRRPAGAVGALSVFPVVILTVLWLVVPGSAAADRVCFLPPALYVAVLAYRGDFAPSRYRQMDLFSLFWKVYPVFAVMMTLFDQGKLLEASLPAALITVISSVLLLRSLRHEPEVYLRRGYQLYNFLCAGALTAAAWGFSRPAVLRAAGGILSACWHQILVPVLSLIFTALSLVFAVIFQLIGRILPIGSVEPGAVMEFFGKFSGQETAALPESGGTGIKIDWQTVLFFLGAAVFAILVFAFFRWLLMRRPEEEKLSVQVETIDHTPPQDANPGKNYKNSQIRRVRELYRDFLRFYEKQGGGRKVSDTSLDIAGKAEAMAKERKKEQGAFGIKKRRYSQAEQPVPADSSKPDEVFFALRRVYLNARYREEVQEDDGKNMKKLCGEAKRRLR